MFFQNFFLSFFSFRLFPISCYTGATVAHFLSDFLCEETKKFILFFYFALFDAISIPWCVLNGAEIRKIKMLAPAICSFLFCSVAFFILMAQFLSVVFFLPMTFSLHFDWSKMLCAQDKNEPIAFYYFHKIQSVKFKSNAILLFLSLFVYSNRNDALKSKILSAGRVEDETDKWLLNK